VTRETASPREGSQAVRAARRDEAALLGEVLADAFAEDPVFAWLIPPQPRGRDNRMRTFFSMSRSYLRRGKPCYLTSDAPAAALWAEPGAWAMPLSQVILEAAPTGLALRRRLFRALRTQLQIERLHAGQSPPHSYLGYLGTRRDRQGQGLGTQMLAEVLAGADTDGMPAYLESSSERNLPLYERNGFRVVGELQALGHGPAIWRMWGCR
jgi:GNAT superfamily N-acetyltransferase